MLLFVKLNLVDHDPLIIGDMPCFKKHGMSFLYKTLNIQCRVFGVAFYELAPGFYIAAHQG